MVVQTDVIFGVVIPEIPVVLGTGCPFQHIPFPIMIPIVLWGCFPNSHLSVISATEPTVSQPR